MQNRPKNTVSLVNNRLVEQVGTEIDANWDVSDAVSDGLTFHVTQDTIPAGISFKPDGTRMYLTGTSGSIFQYDLATPWDVSTASYNSVSLDGSPEGSDPVDAQWNSDGTRLFVCSLVFDDFAYHVFQYEVSIAWDASSASYEGTNLIVETNPFSIISFAFNGDGTIAIFAGADGAFQYTLSIPWDISTATYAAKSFDMSVLVDEPRSIDISPDGEFMFALNGANDRVYQYHLLTPWDVSTAFTAFSSFYFGSVDSQPRGVAFKPDGTKMYMVGSTTDRVRQYSLPYEEVPVYAPVTVALTSTPKNVVTLQ